MNVSGAKALGLAGGLLTNAIDVAEGLVNVSKGEYKDASKNVASIGGGLGGAKIGVVLGAPFGPLGMVGGAAFFS